MKDHTRIKICGLTTLDDAQAAVDLGADMLGFNFYRPSPRYLAPAECARILGSLRNRGAQAETVGVFVNAPLSEIRAILDDCGLDLAQLHGDEPVELLIGLGERAFKAIRPQSLQAARESLAHYGCDRRQRAPALLLDAARPGRYGGTGQAADWDLAASLAKDYPILLAGGLQAQNAGAAVAQVRPWGVDVASGVESQPGRKDHAKMAEFVAAVRRASVRRASVRRAGVRREEAG
jgi:phosphoribosylanthranilate isomerase